MSDANDAKGLNSDLFGRTPVGVSNRRRQKARLEDTTTQQTVPASASVKLVPSDPTARSRESGASAKRAVSLAKSGASKTRGPESRQVRSQIPSGGSKSFLPRPTSTPPVSLVPVSGRQSCPHRYLSVKKVASRFGVGVATVWRWVNAADGFPAPIRLSKGTTRWLEGDILAFESRRRDEQ